MTEPKPPGVRRTTVTALAVVVAALAAAAGLFVALFLVQRSDIGELETEIAGTERALADDRAELTASESTLDELDRERAELDAIIADLRPCADAARSAIDISGTADQDEFDAAFDQMLTHCGDQP
ncbi:hypothetical protein BLA60_08315 [Actinophytocola xinjiangensis]|uniref:Uncharacterized protein n=1 Tax=Actinophytocola xinjiangensis TaxID=485602 RepID=A0A7Z1AYN9_9PSEU|nr:hypothetical protein [Actinophytocola xinjiangensis]OLF12024.1 hypothetical protein BLA60_08315 [Actinophytocola xinjiangensis]